MIDFFSKEEEGRIIDAIKAAEDHTSGEIRVHLDSNLKRPILDEAVVVFKRLKMDRTALRNGVLIMLIPEKREFCIIGDEGIDALVPDDFWDEERDIMASHFKEGRFADGLVEAIGQVGIKLKEHFPVADDDVNELSDEISFGS